MKIAEDGTVWVACNGATCLLRFGPDAETFQSWPIPSGPLYAGILRHMCTTLAGEALLIHQSGTNHIGRVTVEGSGSR
ncbi:hypothetical protein ACM26W_16110 [Halomonas sp. HK25]|uniref:hypothetical protein n=1 Tax=Halomonas sp. HK25 TaxID=3394321 RepID=UPI0039FBE37C